MRRGLENSRGITLIALVTTIIIIVILTSVAVYTGKDIVEKSKFTAFTTELKIMQTHVNELYQECRDGNTIQVGNTEYTGESIKSIGTNASAHPNAQQVFTLEESGITDSTGYVYFNKQLIQNLNIEGVDGEYFVNIGKRSIVSCDGVKYKGKTYYTLEQIPESLYNVEYNNSNVSAPTIGSATMESVSEGKWRITVSNIQYSGYVTKWVVNYKLETDLNWSTSEDLSFIVTENGNYKVKVSNGSIESGEVTVEKHRGRPGINIGDYVQYEAPTRSEDYQLSSEVSGYSRTQTIGQEYTIWRVLNIYNDGSMDLVATVKGTNTGIFLEGALGYNNGIYVFNYICNYLYQNEAKGVTARSINIEDIKSKMSQTCIEQINSTISESVTNCNNSGVIESKDTANNVVTYKNSYSHYPDIFKYQIGSGVNTSIILKEGDICDENGRKSISESESFYKDSAGRFISTVNTSVQATNITAKQTYYDITNQSNYFLDYNGTTSTYYNMLFPTSIKYWIGSRFTNCTSQKACFGLRIVDGNKINGNELFSSDSAGSRSTQNKICPVIHIEKTVDITVCTGTNTESNPHEVDLNN